MNQVTMNEIRQMSIQQIRARNIKIAQNEQAIAKVRARVATKIAAGAKVN